MWPNPLFPADLVLTKFSFWDGDWALGYNSMESWDFPDFS